MGLPEAETLDEIITEVQAREGKLRKRVLKNISKYNLFIANELEKTSGRIVVTYLVLNVVSLKFGLKT